MSLFLVKCLVNGEILSTWLIYTNSFTVVASQIILETMVNCSLDNLEIISIVYYKRPLGEMCDCKN